MQYGSTKITKITLREDWPVSISSRQYQANLDTLGFNMNFIEKRNPKLAVEIIKLWREAQALREDDASADEDLLVAEAELTQLLDAPQR